MLDRIYPSPGNAPAWREREAACLNLTISAPTENGKKVLKMDEYIERGEAIEAVKHAWSKGLEPSQYIEIIPASDVAPLRHAKWVDNHCTACGMMPMGDEMWKNYDCEPPLFERFMDYCPNCGAKMDGGADNG